MAEDKKKPFKDVAAPKRTNFEEIVFLLAGLLILAVIINQIVNYLNSLGVSGSSDDLVAVFQAYLRPFWSVWKVIAVILSATSVVWAIYSKRKLGVINKEEEKIYSTSPEQSLVKELTEENIKEKENEKWVRIKEHLNSDNPADWRLAIIEADIMLEEMLRTLNYHGDSVGEMLKSVDPSDMLTLDAAWEAHKIRNSIAHGGSDFQLSEREARRAIALFETVFQEFMVI